MSGGNTLGRSTRGVTATADQVNAALTAATLTAAEVAVIDGVTPGTAAASKAVVLSSGSAITGIGTIGSAAVTVTSAAAAALAVGRLGATTPAFQVDASAGTQATGFKVTGGASAGTVAGAVVGSGTNAALTIDAMGNGTVTINGTATGIVVLPAGTTIGGQTVAALGVITSASANALAVGLAGATNPAFNVDSSTGSQAAGLNVTGATAAGEVAVAVISSGGAANLAIDAKGTGTIKIGNTSTGVVTIKPATTITGILTPTGGVGSPVALTKVPKPYGRHTCGIPVIAATDGTDSNNVNTEAYCAAITIPANVSSTGVSIFNGSAVAGNVKVYLFNSDGTAALAATASTAQSGTDAYQRIAWVGGPIALVGPATYYLCWTGDTSGATQKVNLIPVGEGPAWKETGATYGTLATITPATTFTTNLAPYATLY